jgi:predicted dehydrogenase
VWNPDIGQPIRFLDGWRKEPGGAECANAFRAQWEIFLRHVADDAPFPWTLLEGAKGVQLAEKALESSRLRAWVDVGPVA